MSNFNSRRNLGKMGESIAAEFLRRKGYNIVASNYRRPWGEIDLIAEKGNEIGFIELKTVTRETEIPEELVDYRKLKKVSRTAELYMQNRKDEREYQVDVVGVILDMATRKAKCRLFEQALGDGIS